MINKARIASELLGLGAGGGLEKLTIHYRYGKQKSDKVEALFNPSGISMSRSVNYRQKLSVNKGDAGYFDIKQKFLAVEAATLSIELFFDTYESRTEAATWKRAASSLIVPTNPFQSGDASDVREHTRKIVNLALPDTELHKPPVCTLKWGNDE